MRWILLAAVGACTAYDPSLGDTPFLCGAVDPKCPDGYTCVVDGASGKSVCTDTAPTTPTGTCTMTFSGALATWDLTSQTGDEDTAAVTTSATGVVAGAISRSTGLTPSAGTGSINASNWPSTATADATKYFTFSVAPPAGCTLAVSSVAVDAKASATGPTDATIATSVDAFGTHANVSTATAMSVALAASATTMLELRIYGFNATAAGGTFRIENMLVVTGELK